MSDWAKLQKLGNDGGCNPTVSGCPKEFAFSNADRITASADVYNSVRQMAYEKLLPLSFRIFALVRQGNSESHKVRPAAPNAVHYKCGAFRRFRDYSDAAFRYATGSLLQELDPVGGDNGWDSFMLSTPPGVVSNNYSTPPSDALLGRAFGPISLSGDPKAPDNGAAVSLRRLTIGGKYPFFWGSPSESISCYWEQ